MAGVEEYAEVGEADLRGDAEDVGRLVEGEPRFKFPDDPDAPSRSRASGL